MVISDDCYGHVRPRLTDVAWTALSLINLGVVYAEAGAAVPTVDAARAAMRQPAPAGWAGGGARSW